jgi:excisionase family DNA binding protein
MREIDLPNTIPENPGEIPDSSKQGGGILTMREVADILHCSKAHVSNIINGKIPNMRMLTHVAIGRRKLVRREWLEQWMEENKSR